MDARADDSADVGRISGKLLLHALDGGGNDVLDSSLPTGMNGGNSLLPCIVKENRHTIGCLHTNAQASLVGDESVNASDVVHLLRNSSHKGGMSLMSRKDDRKIYRVGNVCGEGFYPFSQIIMKHLGIYNLRINNLQNWIFIRILVQISRSLRRSPKRPHKSEVFERIFVRIIFKDFYPN